MTDSALGHVTPMPAQPAPSGDAWVTSLWQEMFTSETTTLLDGAITTTPMEQPLLWQFVRQLALETNTEAPTVLRVVGNAHVVTHEEPYTLDVGVPFLLALDQGDLGEIVSRVMAEREQNRAYEEPEQQRSRLGRLGAKLRSSTPTPRRSRPSGTARLEKAIDVATQWWIDEFVHPDLTDNLVPRPVYLGLAELLAERGGEIADAAGLEPRAALPDQPNADEPALFLLMDPDGLFESVARAGLPPGTGELDWDDAMARWANRRSRAASIILFRCAQPKVTSLWSLLDVVEQGNLPQRVAHALRSRSADVEDCVFLLTGVLADALADVGAGMLTCSWGGVIDLVSETEGALDLSGVARQVVTDPAVVPYLRDILREYAVSPDWYPSDEGTGEDRALTAFLAASGARQAPGTGFLTGMTPS